MSIRIGTKSCDLRKRVFGFINYVVFLLFVSENVEQALEVEIFS